MFPTIRRQDSASSSLALERPKPSDTPTRLYFLSQPVPADIVSIEITVKNNGIQRFKRHGWLEVSVLRCWHDDAPNLQPEAFFNDVRGCPQDFGADIQDQGWYFETLAGDSISTMMMSVSTITEGTEKQAKWTSSTDKAEHYLTGDDGSVAKQVNDGGRLTVWAKGSSREDLAFIEGISIHVSLQIPSRLLEATLSSRSPSDREMLRSNLERLTLDHYVNITDIDDLNQSISIVHDTLLNAPRGDPTQARLLGNLGRLLFLRFGRTGRVQDLDPAIFSTEQALALTLDTNDHKADLLANLGCAFLARYNSGRDVRDLQASIKATQDAIKTACVDYPEQAKFSGDLGRALGTRYQCIGDINDLEEAISFTAKAVERAPRNSPHRSTWLGDLGASLLIKFQSTNAVSELDSAISDIRQAIALGPAHHSNRASWFSNLAAAVTWKSRMLGQLAAHEEAIALMEQAIASSTLDRTSLSATIGKQGQLLSQCYEQTKNPEYLERSIAAYERAITASSETDPNRAEFIASIGSLMLSRWVTTRNLEDLAVATARLEEAIAEAANSSNPVHESWLGNLAKCIGDRFEQTGQIEDLEACISRSEKAIEVDSISVSNRTTFLGNLGYWKFQLFVHSGIKQDLEDAVSRTQQAVDLAPDGHPYKSEWTNNMATFQSRLEAIKDVDGNFEEFPQLMEETDVSADRRLEYIRELAASAAELSGQYGGTGNTEYLHRAISKIDRAVSLAPSGFPDLPDLLSRLGKLYITLHATTKAPNHIGLGINYIRQANEAISSEDVCNAEWLGALGHNLMVRCKQTGNPDDIDEAISKMKLAVALSAKDTDKATWLAELAAAQINRHHLKGYPSDLEAALVSIQQAISRSSEDQDFDGIAATILFRRYQAKGDRNSLEEAIFKCKRRLANLAETHHSWASLTINLGTYLSSQHECTGDIQLLREAISLTEQAIRTAMQDPIDQAFSMVHLGTMLLGLFQQEGRLEDLNAAIRWVERALAITPKGHPDHSNHLNILGCQYQARYLRANHTEDIQSARNVFEQVIVNTSELHQDRAARFNNLGSTLFLLYSRTNCMDDLEEAIRWLEEAVAITPAGHLKRSRYLHNIGSGMATMYGKTGDPEHAELAAARFTEAMHATSNDHPEHPVYMSSLARLNLVRYQKTDDPVYLEAGLAGLIKCSQSSSATLLKRIANARTAVGILYQMKRLKEAQVLAEDAISLLPLVCSRYISREDQQHVLAQTSGLAADACSLSLLSGDEEVTRALSQIEFGRALVIGLLIDGMSDLSSLQEYHPELSKTYEALRLKTFRPYTDNGFATNHQSYRERHQAEQLLENCEMSIREKPGFENFLSPPSIPDLMATARHGPIVIVNVTDFGAAAIIVTDSHIKSIPLPKIASKAPPVFQQALKRLSSSRESGIDNMSEQQRDIGPSKHSKGDVEFFRWLWVSCVRPILEEVKELNKETGNDELQRMWWIGTGAASSLPFHAAGDGSESALDHMIPSYTPTIKALQHARTLSSQKKAQISESDTVLVVTMPTTPGESPLTGVVEEKNTIKKVVGDGSIVKILQSPNAEQVLQDMRSAQIVHFACHGLSDPLDPSNSHLLLQHDDNTLDKLTVSALLRTKLQHRPRIAYLSACSTAETKAEALADEGIHLTSAFQIAGFAHVVGSLWATDDDTCALLAKHFYEALEASKGDGDEDRAVAWALREAVLKVRRLRPGDVRMWAPYVHSGA